MSTRARPSGTLHGQGSVSPDLRQVRYFLAVADELNFTRAAERLHIAQPPLSAAIRQLEGQLGVSLFDRTSRQVTLTPAGHLLVEHGRELLACATAVFAAVREVERAPAGKLAVGVSPTARFGLMPALLAACTSRVPGVMLYPREDATGTLLHELRAGRLDLVVGFCAPAAAGLARERLRDAPAMLQVPTGHPLAARPSVSLADLRDEPVIVAGGADSPGYTETVLALVRGAGIEPRAVPDPYPDLGLSAVREGLGVAVVAADAFAGAVEGSTLVPLDPPVSLPFDLLWRPERRTGALDAVLEACREVREERGWTAVDPHRH